MADNIKDAQTAKSVRELVSEAASEISDELTEQYKEAIKGKLRQLAKAKKVVRNLELEIEDLEIEIAREIS